MFQMPRFRAAALLSTLALVAISQNASAGTITIVNLLLPAVQKVREARARFLSSESLRMIGAEHALNYERRYPVRPTYGLTAWSSAPISSLHLLPEIEQGELFASSDLRRTSAQRIELTNRLFAGANVTGESYQSLYDQYTFVPFEIRRLSGEDPFPTLRIGQRASATLTVGGGPIEISQHTKLWRFPSDSQDGTLVGEQYGSVLADLNGAFGVGGWGGPLQKSGDSWLLRKTSVFDTLGFGSQSGVLGIRLSAQWDSGGSFDAMDTFKTTLSIDDPNFELVLPSTTSTVPEPSTLALFGLSIAGFLCVGAGRRKAKTSASARRLDECVRV